MDLILPSVFVIWKPWSPLPEEIVLIVIFLIFVDYFLSLLPDNDDIADEETEDDNDQSQQNCTFIIKIRYEVGYRI